MGHGTPGAGTDVDPRTSASRASAARATRLADDWAALVQAKRSASPSPAAAIRQILSARGLVRDLVVHHDDDERHHKCDEQQNHRRDGSDCGVHSSSP